jgi:RND family efflux transporter MFP subunit
MQKNLSTKKYILPLGIFVLLIIVIALVMKTQSTNKKTATANPVVKTALTQEAEKDTALEVSGFVRGVNRADVSPLASGTIVKFLKHEGESVKKGEALAIIRNEQVDAQVAAANAGVSALEKTLRDSKKYYDQLVDEAKANRDADPSDANDEAVQSAERARDLQIQGAKDQLIAAQGSAGIASAGKNNFTLIAPFAGTITTVYGREGGFANFSMPLLSLSTPNSLEIETYVSATEGKRIAVGNVANLQASSGTPLSGIVTVVATGSDSANFKTLVRIRIDNGNGAVNLGEFLHGQISVPRNSQAILIPRKAIVSRGGDQIVFVLDENNVAKEQPIKTETENNGLVEVTAGLGANQKIVVEGQQYLLNGSTTTSYESK